ncbi:MAG: hypothetical protein R2780_05535 [Crocinitomicaceae bacterium]
MKKLFYSSLAVASLTLSALTSCEKDEGKLPEIEFKTGTGYTYADATIAGGTTVKIGIEAKKEENKDVLKKFDISESVNGGTLTSIYNVDVPQAQEDEYEYDFTTTLDTTSGDTHKYTFTITNRDGLTNQVSLTLTIQ